MNFFRLPLKIRNPDLFQSIQNSIEQMNPWYQPIWFDWGLRTVPREKSGQRIGFFSLDRGLVKWWRFIKPNLPFSLKGRRVMDVGCNAGLFLIQAAKMGANEAIGIETDDHYFRQAEFVAHTMSMLHNRKLPISLYKSSIETFDLSRIGRIDLTFFLNSIYHIGKVKGNLIYGPEKIHELQVETLIRVGNHSRYILFQANPLEDEGRGKGRTSLLRLVKEAGLNIYSEKIYPHSRGYILVVQGQR
jgi:hypothetical protein